MKLHEFQEALKRAGVAPPGPTQAQRFAKAGILNPQGAGMGSGFRADYSLMDMVVWATIQPIITSEAHNFSYYVGRSIADAIRLAPWDQGVVEVHLWPSCILRVAPAWRVVDGEGVDDHGL